MIKLNKLANWTAILMLVVLVGCVDDSQKTIAEKEKAPDTIKDQYVQTEIESELTLVKRPPDLIQTKTLLLSEVDGCKTYAVRGEINYFDNARKRWYSEYVKTHFTKCEGESKTVTKWDVREGKRTVEKSSETTTGK